MGCTQSSDAVPDKSDPAATSNAFNEAAAKAPPPPQQNEPNKPRARVDAIDHTVALELGGVRMRYAYLSQRGKYPDDPDKPNQDAYAINHEFKVQATDGFFGVFDGHGKDGDGCAQFTRTYLPQLVERYIEKSKGRKSANSGSPSDLSRDQTHDALHKAHVECNKLLHKNQHIDDSLSGTTAVSAYIHGKRNRITISNVGDSRAVIGQEVRMQSPPGVEAPKSLKALALSRDQTPYRKDERQRIKLTGARILSLDQIEGLEPINDDSGTEEDLELGEELDEGGDPPRVWSPNGDYPGTAFTRSIGDAMAEELGVYGEPELLTREFLPEDKIIVLASDGVFEFLTNQSVIDICAKFADPLEACRAVVAESYELWLQYELRTDDITIICMFIDNVDTSIPRRGSMLSETGRDKSMRVEAAPEEEDEDDLVDSAIPDAEGQRPVRKTMTKEKRKEIEKLKAQGAKFSDVSPDVDVDLKSLYSEKTSDEKHRIADAIRASVMFRNVTDEQKEMIFGVMESVFVKKGTWVIKQGTVGDRFYVIDDGKFEVRIVPDGEEDKDGTGGNTVHVYEGSVERHAHPCFGELALMYSAPRSASIIAQSDGHLWALHRSAFRQVLAQSQDHRQDLKRTLHKVPVLRKLDDESISKIATAMDEVTFHRGESIIEQGRSGRTMYVVHKGQCDCVKRSSSGKVQRGTARTGDFFGHEVISGSKTYNASVVAMQTTTCWQLDSATLHQVMKK